MSKDMYPSLSTSALLAISLLTTLTIPTQIAFINRTRLPSLFPTVHPYTMISVKMQQGCWVFVGDVLTRLPPYSILRLTFASHLVWISCEVSTKRLHNLFPDALVYFCGLDTVATDTLHYTNLNFLSRNCKPANLEALVPKGRPLVKHSWPKQQTSCSNEALLGNYLSWLQVFMLLLLC